MKMCSFHVTVSLAKAKFVKLHIGAMKGGGSVGVILG